VGSIAALSLARYGVKIIAITDAFGGIYNANGINLWETGETCGRQQNGGRFPGGRTNHNEKLLVLPWRTILVPAALERQITAANAGQIRCRILGRSRQWPHHAGSRRHPE